MTERLHWPWFFTKKGFCIWYLISLAILLIHHLFIWKIHHSSQHILVSVYIDALVIISVGLGMVSLHTLNLPNKMSQQSSQPSGKAGEELEEQRQLVYEQMRQFQQMKTQFVINVNHELRTSLTVAFGYFELLQVIFEQSGTLKYETHGAYIQTALHYCEDLRSIITNILALVNVEGSQESLPLVEYSISQIIHETCEQCRNAEPLLQRLNLHAPADILVRAHLPSIRYVLQQLLSNALKFSPEHSPIVVRAEVDTAQPDILCISIQDRGSGIPINEQTAIFEEFTRSQRDLGGTVRGLGLGLPICKQLIESMQGKLWVESTGIPGQGSCFRFTLPRALPTHMPRLSAQSVHEKPDQLVERR